MIVTRREQPELFDAFDSNEVWPEYNLHGDVLNVYWGRMNEEFADVQFLLVEDGEPLAQCHTVPVAWDGTVEGLPKGIDGVALRVFEEGGEATALCAMAAEVPPRNQGRGLARRTLEAMAEVARRHGLPALIAPVRPSRKDRYPLAPIERYAAWRREDGGHLDPWLRIHERLGGEIVATEPESLRITGTVAEWESWTGMAFPESGQYVFPQGLAPLDVDREGDVGAYWEPNVWVVHRL